MNLSYLPFSYSQPVAPDFGACGVFYAEPVRPTLYDCNDAYTYLPTGPAAIIWAINDIVHKDDPHRLPLKVTVGTCQIVFDVSGPSARDLDFVSFSGDQIREMVAWILYNCVGYSLGYQFGGYITKDLNDTVNYLTDPTVRYEDRFPPSTTFFSVWIWNKDIVREWNPGDMERNVCEVIARSLAIAYEKAPAGSAAQANLGRTRLYYRTAWDAMTLGRIQRWWDPIPPRAGLILNVSSSGHNATYSALNASSEEDEAGDVRTTT